MNSTKKNVICKDYLEHMTKAEKKAYNAEYYQKNKDYWRNYYKEHHDFHQDSVRAKIDRANAAASKAVGKSTLVTGPSPDSPRSLDNRKRLSDASQRSYKNKWKNHEYISNYNELSAQASAATGASYAGRAVKSKPLTKLKNSTVNAGRSFIKNWKSGAKSIKNLFS